VKAETTDNRLPDFR